MIVSRFLFGRFYVPLDFVFLCFALSRLISDFNSSSVGSKGPESESLSEFLEAGRTSDEKLSRSVLPCMESGS